MILNIFLDGDEFQFSLTENILMCVQPTQLISLPSPKSNVH